MKTNQARGIIKAFYMLLLVDLFVLIAFYSLVSGPDNRLKLSSLFAVPNQNFIESNDLKKIDIEFSLKDKEHFDRLFRDYTAAIVNVETDPFHAYYSKNNHWRKVNLSIDGKKYSVKIKSHGRTPTGHKYGEHFSLDLKFNKKDYPFYSKRINLTIYNGIQLTGELSKMLASKLELYHPEFELVNVAVDDHEEYLYFAEERINKKFFSRRELPMLIFNKGVDGSLIYNGNMSVSDLTKILKKKLEKNQDLSPELKAQIERDYKTINQSILEKNADNLKKHLDMDYMARLNAFRVVYGSNGHGFNVENFEMAYDTINRVFYPIVHRDMKGSTLENCQNPYPYMDGDNQFWKTLDGDQKFLQKTEKELNAFLLNNDLNSIENEIDEIHNHYKQAFKYEFIYNNMDYGGYWIINNMKHLKKL